LWASDTIMMAFVTNATVPSKSTADPRWGAGGTTNFATNEVTPGGNYTAGGVALTGLTVTRVGAITYLNAASPITITGDPANPTGAYWAIFYASTDAGKRCLAFMDLSGPVSLVNGYQGKINGSLTGTQPVLSVTP
jgi:hypothetical protein